MPETILYHNPRCSKSRQTLELLEKHQIKFTVVEYLKTPPSTKEIKHILKLLNLTPRELMRKNEAEYKEQQLDNQALSIDDLITAMHQYPKIIQRPIVVHDNKAAIGRPPESVLELF